MSDDIVGRLRRDADDLAGNVEGGGLFVFLVDEAIAEITRLRSELQAAVAEEREACAIVAEATSENYTGWTDFEAGADAACERIAASIRARSRS